MTGDADEDGGREAGVGRAITGEPVRRLGGGGVACIATGIDARVGGVGATRAATRGLSGIAVGGDGVDT